MKPAPWHGNSTLITASTKMGNLRSLIGTLDVGRYKVELSSIGTSYYVYVIREKRKLWGAPFDKLRDAIDAGVEMAERYNIYY